MTTRHQQAGHVHLAANDEFPYPWELYIRGEIVGAGSRIEDMGPVLRMAIALEGRREHMGTVAHLEALLAVHEEKYPNQKAKE
jgi:hypothetical protein